MKQIWNSWTSWQKDWNEYLWFAEVDGKLLQFTRDITCWQCLEWSSRWKFGSRKQVITLKGTKEYFIEKIRWLFQKRFNGLLCGFLWFSSQCWRVLTVFKLRRVYLFVKSDCLIKEECDIFTWSIAYFCSLSGGFVWSSHQRRSCNLPALAGEWSEPSRETTPSRRRFASFIFR